MTTTTNMVRQFSRFVSRRLSQSAATNSSIQSKIPMRWLDLRGSSLSIYERLLLEEYLFKLDDKVNWVISGYHDPSRHRFLDMSTSTYLSSAAIVMGIGGKPAELLNLDNVREDNVLTIKRFSGGGTVLLDYDSIWVTIIGRPQFFENSGTVKSFPRPIMEYTQNQLYNPLFSRLVERQASKQVELYQNRKKTLVADTASCGLENSGRVTAVPCTALSPSSSPLQFSLQENDYALGDKKVGGNAQAITATGWLHHTSFLWDYDEELMRDYLTLPQKRPDYRGDRSHIEFLAKLKNVYPSLSKQDFFVELKTVCQEVYDLCEVGHSEAFDLLGEGDRGSGLRRWMEEKSRNRIVDIS